MSSYFGGRSEVRTRRVDVPVRVVDFTSMYPSIFLLENLQELLMAEQSQTRDATDKARRILAEATLEGLYKPAAWLELRCIVRIRPNGATLPVRFRMSRDDPYTIAVTPFTSSHDRWYTLADIIAAKLLGGTEPEILEATEFFATERQTGLKPVYLLGVTLDPRRQVFCTVVEERQRYKDVNPALAHALKILANSGAYGIYAEINVTPTADAKGKNGKGEREAVERARGLWYADIGPEEGKTHNGSFSRWPRRK
jgi:DNA polymerase elongation subunit (family B)